MRGSSAVCTRVGCQVWEAPSLRMPSHPCRVRAGARGQLLVVVGRVSRWPVLWTKRSHGIEYEGLRLARASVPNSAILMVGAKADGHGGEAGGRERGEGRARGFFWGSGARLLRSVCAGVVCLVWEARILTPSLFTPAQSSELAHGICAGRGRRCRH